MNSPELTDIHNHLVPGVDDGAQSMDESLRHLTALFDDGVTRLSVSPHLFGWLTEEPGALAARIDCLEEAFDEMHNSFAGRNDVPQLFFGQEILCPTVEITKRVFVEPRAGYRGTRYALVEFGFDLPDHVPDIIAAVLDAGRRIIISHPERYRRTRVNVHIDELHRWKAGGALLQINAGSLMGDYGSAIEALAWQAVEQGLADIIATDHHADSRVVSPRAAFDLLQQKGYGEAARVLMSENTTRVLQDRELLPL